MMSERKRAVFSLIGNLVIFLLAIPGAIMSMGNHGAAGSFVYYTQDSNLLLGIAAAVYSLTMIRGLANGTVEVPAWVRILKYLSVCCIAVTFFVVLFILAPMAGELGGLRWLLFTDSMLFQHFLNPVIGLVEFILLEKKPVLHIKITYAALVPTLVYAAVLYPLNIAGNVDGPYPFLQVHHLGAGMSVLWFFILLVLSWILAFLGWIANRKIRIL